MAVGWMEGQVLAAAVLCCGPGGACLESLFRATQQGAQTHCSGLPAVTLLPNKL